MIYPYKLIIQTFINQPFIWIGALGSHIGVKMTIFGITLQVKPGWNISWECSIPLKPISLFLRVNKEGLCDGKKVRGIVIFGNLIFVIFGVEEKETFYHKSP